MNSGLLLDHGFLFFGGQNRAYLLGLRLSFRGSKWQFNLAALLFSSGVIGRLHLLKRRDPKICNLWAFTAA